MHEPILVRPYAQEHQAGVLDVILPIQQQEYGIAITGEDQPDLFRIESFYQTGQGNFWVALHDQQVVGTIALLDIGANKAALRKMFVAQDYRGPAYGTASRLLHTLLQWAREQGLEEIYLGTTPQFVAAHRFYEKHGFQLVPREELPAAFPVMVVDDRFYKYVVSA